MTNDAPETTGRPAGSRQDRIRARLIRQFTEDLPDPDGGEPIPGQVLDPADYVLLDNAAALLAEAEALEGQVRRDGRMINGGMRAGVKVIHPAIAQAERNRTAADRVLRPLRPAPDTAPRGHNARSAAGVRWSGRL